MRPSGGTLSTRRRDRLRAGATLPPSVPPMMKKIAVLHGPNLDRLGKRQPEIYGTTTLKDLEKLIRTESKKLGLSPVFFQSAHEGALVDKIHALNDGGIQ